MQIRLAISMILSLVLAAAASSADDMPRRKSGLWELKMTTPAGGSTTMKQCIDQATDDLIRGAGARPECSKNEWKREGDRILTESVCKQGQSVLTTKGVFTGDFETSFKGEVTLEYDPPMMGMKQARTSQSGRWIGPCKDGMKPGDMILPDGRIMNMQKKKP